MVYLTPACTTPAVLAGCGWPSVEARPRRVASSLGYAWQTGTKLLSPRAVSGRVIFVAGPRLGRDWAEIGLAPRECLHTGYLAPQDQRLDGVGAFVGVDGFHVGHVACHMVF